MPVNLTTILSKDPDLQVYQIQPADAQTQATIGLANWKELQLAVNVCSRRIYDLVNDLERAEERIEHLERLLHAIGEDNET